MYRKAGAGCSHLAGEGVGRGAGLVGQVGLQGEGRVGLFLQKREETLLKSLRWGRADAKVSTWPQGPQESRTQAQAAVK